MTSNVFSEDNPIWERPVLVPIPLSESVLFDTSVILSDGWKFSFEPPQNYWTDDVDTTDWDNVPVPAELFALGYDIRRDTEYVYKKYISIPSEWTKRKLILKIGMAYEYSKIWVGGKFVREHEGGFTTYDCDITDYVIPGQSFWVTIMCKHRSDCLIDWPTSGNNTEGGYVGLIDDVMLIALPHKHLTRFLYETDFDDAYTNAILKVTAAVAQPVEDKCELNLFLIDPSGNKVTLEHSLLTLDTTSPQKTLDIPIAVPLKWDAEHPDLYCLVVNFDAGDGVQLQYRLMVGFRKVEKKGNNLYVNGVRTKLRGAALYGHDPILGKVFTKKQLEKIVKAAKWANINYLRSSAYPERSILYDLCDQYGIYVEECAPANFQRGTWDSQKDMKFRHTSDLPAYRANYMNQFAEMIERDRSHPSIIIWEYANESDWGINFKTELDYLKIEDQTRMTAGTWDNTKTSLASYHYPEYNEIFNNASIYDEYVHIATHSVKTLKRDPAIRNAWGLSIQKGWEALYAADGVVGAAIFAMGDYIIQRPDGRVFANGFGQWGLIDSWGREKPELWLTKKAYSPVKLPEKYVKKPAKNMKLAIGVENRYNNTNLQEVLFRWNAGEETGEFWGPQVAPGHMGALLLPVREWSDGDKVSISIHDINGVLIDEYLLNVGQDISCRIFANDKVPAPDIIEDEKNITILGSNFYIVFCKKTGLIVRGDYQDRTLIKKGPYLNIYGAYYKPSVFQNDRQGEFAVTPSGWEKESIQYRVEENEVILDICGTYPGGKHKDMWQFEYSYDPIRVNYKIYINGNGLITTEYQIINPPKEYLFEVGISYILHDDIDMLSWERNGQYSVYPKDHIGRTSGLAKRYRGYGKDEYRKEPEWAWSEDETNYAIYGGADLGMHGTNDFISSRENVWFASAVLSNRHERVRVESDGSSVSVRVCPACDEDPGLEKGIKLTINNCIYYDLGNGSNPSKTGDGYLGNFTYPEIHLDDGYIGRVQIRLTDNDEYTDKNA